jgi:hypothetical protein
VLARGLFSTAVMSPRKSSLACVCSFSARLPRRTPTPLARAGGQSRQLDRVAARFWPTMNHLYGKKKDAAPPPKATDVVTDLKEVCAAPRPQSCTRCKSRRLAADATVPSRLRPAAYPKHAEARGVLTEEGGRGAYVVKGLLQEEGLAGGAYGAQEEEALRDGAHAATPRSLAWSR